MDDATLIRIRKTGMAEDLVTDCGQKEPCMICQYTALLVLPEEELYALAAKL